nr:uncharacterized protein LOC105095034 [Camelus dromedarius]
MPKEGTELVISQVFPLGAQTEGLEADKTESLLHSNFDVNTAPLGQESAGGRSDSLNVAPHTPGGLYRDVGKGRNHRSSQRSHLAHPTRPHPPGSLIWNLEAEGTNGAESLAPTQQLPRAPAAPAGAGVPRAVAVPAAAETSGAWGQSKGVWEDRAAGTHRGEDSPARVLACPRRAVPPRRPLFPASRGRHPGPGRLRRCSGSPPPAHHPRLPQLGRRRSTRSSWSSCRCRRGWRRPTGQTIRGRRPGVRGVRSRVGARTPGTGDGWEEPRAGGPLGAPPPPTPAPGGPGGRRDQPGRGRFSWLVTETVLQLFWAPLRVCLGPAPGSFRTRQTEDLATRAPGRCPLRRRCERALAGALPSRASRRGAGPGAPARLRAYGRRLTTEPSGSLKGLFSPFIQASLWSKGKRVS